MLIVEDVLKYVDYNRATDKLYYTTIYNDGTSNISYDCYNVDSNGNKKTVVREETGDGQVREYLLGEGGKKIDMNVKQIARGSDDNEGSHHHHQQHGNNGHHGNQKKTTKKQVLKKK